ncbi:hypothetical protein [Pseudomonas graminis]|nr:hypothetical protein [Pseudomonas graminis]
MQLISARWLYSALLGDFHRKHAGFDTGAADAGAAGTLGHEAHLRLDGC